MMTCEIWVKKFEVKQDEDYMIIKFDLNDMDLDDNQLEHLKDIIEEAKNK